MLLFWFNNEAILIQYKQVTLKSEVSAVSGLIALYIHILLLLLVRPDDSLACSWDKTIVDAAPTLNPENFNFS